MVGTYVERIPLPSDIIGAYHPPGEFNSEQKEHGESQGNLVETILHLRDHWEEEGLPKDYINLPGIGFMISTQMGFLNSGRLVNLDFQQRRELFTRLSDYSLRSWVGEYLAQRATLPGLLTISNEEDGIKLRDTLHGAGMELEDTLSKKERNQVPYDVYINTVKPFLINAVSGSMAVINSPSGPSGMSDETGKMIDYPTSRLSILVKDGKNVFIYTVSNDFSNEEHRELISRLRRYAGMEPSNLTEDSPVEDYIKNVALFDYKTMPLSPKDIINIMGQVRPSPYIYQNRTFDTVRGEVEDWKSLWHYDSFTDRFINEFTHFVRHQKWDSKTLKEAMAVTILRLSRHVLEKEKNVSRLPGLEDTVDIYDYDDPADLYRFGNFGDVYKKVKTIPGCAGGGETSENEFSKQFDAAAHTIFGEEVENDSSLCNSELCNGMPAHFHCTGKEGKYCNFPIVVNRKIHNCPSCNAGAVCA